MFQTDISLGNLLTLASFIVFITLYIANSRITGKLLAIRLESVDASLEDFKLEVKKLADIITKQALQDQRISLQDDRLLHEGKRVDELERRVNLVFEQYAASELALARRTGKLGV